MDLLFKREQARPGMGRTNFRLWSKIELNGDEQAIVKRYHFDEAILIEAIQPTLIRNSIIVAVLAFFTLGIVVGAFVAALVSPGLGSIAAFPVAIASGYWYFHAKRETIFVRDLLHGRHFKCASVIELARKEAWLTAIVGFLRQVMESAKHWDGTERHEVEPLPPEEARQFIIKGI